ncbi:fibroblast growth factor receptor-like [Daphnia carinata]|uniref:fibroblast growth factor receptor-like n=1 Tax=Daphnia carinata TaxID=120202 RepID=UPI0025802602|nr:fibroblast growth factor receptor-like [Daphnia carinata]
MEFFCILVWLISCWTIAQCNTPPTIVAERSWSLPENTAVGTRVNQFRGSDSDNDVLNFFVGSPSLLPGLRFLDGSPFFRVDSRSGAVYLKEPINGMRGQRLMIGAGVNDGVYNAKMDIVIQVTPSDGSELPPLNNRFNSFPLPASVKPPPILSSPTSPGLPPRPPSPPALPGSSSKEVDFSNSFVPPPVKPVTERADWSITPSVPIKALASRMPQLGISETQTTEKTSTDDPGVVKADRIEPAITAVIVPVIVGLVLIILVILGSSMIWMRSKRPRRASQGGPSSSIDEEKETKIEAVKTMSNTTTSSADQDEHAISLQHWTSKKAVSNRYESWHIGEIDQEWRNKNQTKDGWEFPRHRLHVISILGEGCFGQVWKCQALNIAGLEGSSFVAVKTLKESAGDKERQDLLKELQVMKSLKPHPNIVTLFGCCTDKDPVFVIMEYVNGGKLQSFLRQSRADHYYGNLYGASSHLSSRDLTSFAYQVSRAMEFLNSKGIIHRDLAARNVLINEERVCKVADFGFARDIMGNHIYERKSEGRLPIRWMAPESLYDNVFSSKTDVWSFGVLLWEIVTLGSTPYPGMTADAVMRKVREGYRLEKPDHCKREVYNVMFYCWEKDAAQRPAFNELVELLEQLLMSETDYIELERFPDHSYYNMVPPTDEKV